MSKFDQPSPVIKDSATKANIPATQTNPVTAETQASKETQIDFEEHVLQFFKEDVEYMVDLFEKGVRSTENWAHNDDSLMFCAFILSNPDDPLKMPIIITRPSERPKQVRKYIDGSEHKIFHKDIWNDWHSLALSNPTAKRATVFNWINGPSDKYRDAIHFFLKIKKVNGKIVISTENGWGSIKSQVAQRLWPEKFAPQLDREEIEILLKQLQKYGLNTEEITMRENPALVESFVLERMLEPTIQKNAEKLRRVLTPRAVREYISLANRFLTNPNPDKASPFYAKFLEYEEILAKLG